MSKSYFYIFLLSTFFQCTLFMHSHNFTLIIHVLMKKREPCCYDSLTVSKYHLQCYRGVQIICSVIVQLFFWGGQVTLYNECEALHVECSAGYMYIST